MPCIGRQTLNHCATREAPVYISELAFYQKEELPPPRFPYFFNYLYPRGFVPLIFSVEYSPLASFASQLPWGPCHHPLLLS